MPPPPPRGGGLAQLAVLLLAWLAAAATIVLVLSGCSGSSDSSDGPAPQTLQLLAGPPAAGGQGRLDGQGHQARLSVPSAIAAAADGGAWLIDDYGQRLRRVSAAGEVRTVRDLSQLPAAPDDASGHVQRLVAAHHLAEAPDGAVHLALLRVTVPRGAAQALPADALTADMVVDRRWAVVRLDAAGTVRVVATDPQPGLLPGALADASGLNALAFDAQGRLHVADPGACTVWRVGGDGGLEPVFQSAPVRWAADACRSLAGSAGRITRLSFDRQGGLWVGLRDGSLWRAGGWAPGSGPAEQVAGPVRWGMDGCGGMAHLSDGRVVLAGWPRHEQLASWRAGDGVQPWLGAEGDTRWVDGDSKQARFKTVCALAPSPDGGVWAVDTLNHAVRWVGPHGQVRTWLGLPAQQGWRDGAGPAALFEAGFGLAANGDRLWVADAGNQVLRQVDTAGRVQTVSGLPVRVATAVALDGAAHQVRWASPQAMAPGPGGSWWVGDTSAVRLRQANGDVHTVADAGPGRVQALAALPGGDVAVLASDHRWGDTAVRSVTRLWQVSADGTRLALLPADAAPLVQAAEAGVLAKGLCRAPDGSLFFTLGYAVLRRSPSGQLAVVAGHVIEPGAVDGPGLQARFRSPAGLACDDAGRVYVADRDSHTVRRIGTDGEVRTVLGRLGVQGQALGAAPGGLDHPSQVVLVPDGLVVASGHALVKARW